MKFTTIALASAVALASGSAFAAGAPRGTVAPSHPAAPRAATSPGTTGMGTGATTGLGGGAGGIQSTVPNNGVSTSANGCTSRSPTSVQNSPGVGSRPGC